jgi:ABC-type glycerol-3-phosphate transport system substrate-binding protein
MKKKICSLIVIGSLVSLAIIGGMATESAAEKVTLMVWHDLGKKGIAWFDELSALYQEDHPDVEIKSVTYPTQQWIEKSIAALNTNTAPDLIFNNYERVIKVDVPTKKVMDLKDLLAEVGDTSFLSDQDLQIATYKGKMIIFPIQRVQMAFGARKSWLENIGAEFPKTWSECLEVAKKFTEGDPDQNGTNGDTYGFALEAANPRDLIHMLDLFTFGTGVPHTIIDPEGNIVINNDRHKEVTKELVKVFTEYQYTPKDTVNYSFTEMYQVIEGSRAGMFRVGDWNVNKWDQEDVLNGDFVIGTWPAFREGDSGQVVIGGMRGVAIPENSPHKEEAMAFAKFMLSKEAQRASFKHIGASVRGDYELEMSDHQKFFSAPQFPLIAYDFPESIHPFYPQIEEIYHKALLNALTDPDADLDAILEKAEEDIKAYIAKQK